MGVTTDSKEARQNNLSIRGSERSRNRDHPSFHGTDYSVEPPNLRCMIRFLVSDRLPIGIITNVRNVSFPGTPSAHPWSPKCLHSVFS